MKVTAKPYATESYSDAKVETPTVGTANPQILGHINVKVIRTETVPIIPGPDYHGFGYMIEESLAKHAREGNDVCEVSVDISGELWRQMDGRSNRD